MDQQNNLHPAAQSLFDDVETRLERAEKRTRTTRVYGTVSITSNNIEPETAVAFKGLAARRGVSPSRLGAMLIEAYVRTNQILES